MTPQQIRAIPSELLKARDTGPLREYLAARGLRLTLLELDAERRSRSLRPPIRRRPHRDDTTPATAPAPGRQRSTHRTNHNPGDPR